MLFDWQWLKLFLIRDESGLLYFSEIKSGRRGATQTINLVNLKLDCCWNLFDYSGRWEGNFELDSS